MVQIGSAREGRPAGDAGLRRKAWVAASVLALIALLVGALFGDRGMLQLIAQRERASVLEREIEELRAENLQLAADIQRLRSDPRAIERIAREELGLARPGETVFLIRGSRDRSRP
jgi:cell division protein FtsB